MTDTDDKFVEGILDRHPVYIGGQTIMLITVFTANDFIGDMWTIDYQDHMMDQKKGARQLIKQISDHASMNFFWELRDAIKEEIIKQNEQFGTKFEIDRPPK